MERFGRNCFQVLFFPGANLGLLRNELQTPRKVSARKQEKKKWNTKKAINCNSNSVILLNRNTTFSSVDKMKVQPGVSKSKKAQQKDPHTISSMGTMRIGPEFKSRISEHEGKILALATRNVLTLPPTATIMDAIKIMTEKRFRRIPITNAGTRRLEGVVTSVDIIDFLGGGRKNLLVENRFKGNLLAAINEEVRQIMETDIPYLSDQADFKDAVSTMIERRTGGLPIVNSDMQVVAIFTERNALELMGGLVTNRTVDEYMTENVKMISTDTPIGQAAKVMVDNRLRRLPVVKDGIFAGIITSSDIIHFLGNGEAFSKLTTGNIHEALDQPVGSIVSRELIWTGPGTDLGKAMEIMLEKKIGSLPVLDNGLLRGIITERDLLRSLK
ncbi:CBS domain-containing protein [Methanosarcina barkeri CM1]|uniref:CBS domain-containing protein n=1 Tax=Methanosarcina barkeri CM1 TaxID=796385 RepID=A0A0G3CB22_METBA|nr:CBS domain-containing protein [Methanosarcina barkeri CM1]